MSFINIPSYGAPTWKDTVATVLSLPASGNTTGDARVANDTSIIYVWSGSAWVAAGGSGGIASINADTTSAQVLAVGTSGTDFALVNNGTGTHTFNLPDAGASARGVVTTGTQTIAGAKTFSSQITSTVSTGTAPLVVASTTQVANLNAATAGKATNIAGGAGGSIPYQSAADTTALLANGTAGQVLKSAGGTSAPTWGAYFDPTTTFVLFDDFAAAAYNGSGVVYSDYTWLPQFQNAGSITAQGSTIPSDNGHIGVLQFTTSTNNNDGAGIITGQVGGTVTQAFVGGNGQITFEALIYIPTLSDGVNNLQINVGFRDGPGWSAAANSWNIQYQLESSTKWQLITTASTVQTATTSSVTVTTGWHHVKLVMNAAGTSVEGFVDGVSLGTNSTNVPTLKLPPLISARKTLGTTAMFLGLDYIKIDKTFTTPR